MPPRSPARRDPATGEPLNPGDLTRAELAAWLAEDRRRWQGRLMTRGRPPDEGGGWAWVGDEIGWCRRSGGVKGTKGANKS